MDSTAKVCLPSDGFLPLAHCPPSCGPPCGPPCCLGGGREEDEGVGEEVEEEEKEEEEGDAEEGPSLRMNMNPLDMSRIPASSRIAAACSGPYLDKREGGSGGA
jgi:hypothetical protein